MNKFAKWFGIGAAVLAMEVAPQLLNAQTTDASEPLYKETIRPIRMHGNNKSEDEGKDSLGLVWEKEWMAPENPDTSAQKKGKGSSIRSEKKKLAGQKEKLKPTNDASVQENFGFMRNADEIRLEAGYSSQNTPMTGKSGEFSSGISANLPINIMGRQLLTGGELQAYSSGSGLKTYTVVRFPGTKGRPDWYAGFNYELENDSAMSRSLYSLLAGMDRGDYTVVGMVSRGSDEHTSVKGGIDYKQPKFALSFMIGRELVARTPFTYQAGVTLKLDGKSSLDLNFADRHHVGVGHDLKFGAGYFNDWRDAFSYKISAYLQSVKDTKTWGPHAINGAGVNVQVNFKTRNLMRK